MLAITILEMCTGLVLRSPFQGSAFSVCNVFSVAGAACFPAGS